MQGGFCLEFVSERVDLLLRGHGLSAAGPACGADRLMERAARAARAARTTQTGWTGSAHSASHSCSGGGATRSWLTQRPVDATPHTSDSAQLAWPGLEQLCPTSKRF